MALSQNSYVSLWVGVFKNKNAFQSFLTDSCDEDGNCIQSQFETLFKINADNDFREIVFVKDKTSITELIKGCSYENDVAKILNDSEEVLVNSAILLYNYKYENDITVFQSENKQNTLKFIGYGLISESYFL